jgi:hypothetical protein
MPGARVFAIDMPYENPGKEITEVKDHDRDEDPHNKNVGNPAET